MTARKRLTLSLPEDVWETLAAAAPADQKIGTYAEKVLTAHVSAIRETDAPKLTKEIWVKCKAWYAKTGNHRYTMPDSATPQDYYLYALGKGFKP